MQTATKRERRWAQNQVKYQVYLGNLPRVQTLKCFHCGSPARDYDHYLGYRPEHKLHVLPVCRSCHRRIMWIRGEIVRTPKMDVVARKLSAAQASEIKKLLKLGISQQGIADNYGVSQGTISNIALGKHYKEVA